MVGDSSLDFVPERMKEPDERDLYIKKGEKVDEDNYVFELVKDDEDKLLAEFEKDDEAIKNIREINANEVYDVKTVERINTEKILMNGKKKLMATLPTVLEYYNSGIVNPNNKFLL